MASPPSRNKKKTSLRRLLAVAAVLATAPAPALADWRQELGTFRIGVAMQNGERFPAGRFDGFREAAAAALGMPVEIFQARDAPALIDAQASSRIEYSILSALGYATAYGLCECIEPIAAPVSDDGATGIRSILLADTAKIGQVADLAGARIAAGPGGAVGGDLLPAAGFAWQGKPLARSGLDIVRPDSTQEALRMLAAGEVAAVFTWEYVRPGSAIEFGDGPQAYLRGLGQGDYRVLWRSDPVRFGPHAVRRNLPPEARSALRRMLLTLDNDRPYIYDAVSPALGGGFQSVSHDDYRSALELVEAVASEAQ